MRWYLFSKKQSEAENLPPTKAALKYKILRSHYVTMMWKRSDRPNSELRDPYSFGWQNVDGIVQHVLSDELPAPEASIEMCMCKCNETRCSTNYTYLRNKRMRRCGVAPPPIIFERLKLPQQIIYRRKENLSESPNHQKYWENILVSRFYEQFSRNRRNLGHFRKFEKISNSQNMNILYIILKHVIWRFQIYNLFREIFKFREDKSNNVFREIRKCFRKTAKFKFFAKQIIYLGSPDHPLQNDV